MVLFLIWLYFYRETFYFIAHLFIGPEKLNNRFSPYWPLYFHFSIWANCWCYLGSCYQIRFKAVGRNAMPPWFFHVIINRFNKALCIFNKLFCCIGADQVTLYATCPFMVVDNFRCWIDLFNRRIFFFKHRKKFNKVIIIRELFK